MNPTTEKYCALLKENRPDPPADKYLGEVIHIRKLMKGPSLEEQKPEPKESSDSDYQEIVVDVQDQVALIKKLQQSRNPPGPNRNAVPI